jgi:hypothetical protein
MVGCTESGAMIGDGTIHDDYDRACVVEGWAGVISNGPHALALVLADEPALTCYLPEQSTFIRWLAADSAAELIDAATAILNGPAAGWEDCGVWETDGPAILMDSAHAGASLDVEYPDGTRRPEYAMIPIPAGQWSVRALHRTDDFPWVGVVQLLPGG